jgi:hypothetical protein
LAAITIPVRGTSTVPMTRKTYGRSFGSLPVVLVRSFGSRPKVVLPSMELICAPAAFVPLDTCSPYSPENVSEPKTSHPWARHFLTAITRPSYVIEYPFGLVSRKRRSAVELRSTNTGKLRPSGNVRASSRY